MTLSFENFITAQEIMADALVNINDEEQKLFRPGWYQRNIHTGMKRLNYAAPYLRTYTDIAIHDNLIIDVPAGVFNIVDIFVWSGEDCVLTDTQRVFHKDGFFTSGHLKGSTARNNGQPDLFINTYGSASSVLYYNTHNGSIMLSDACYGYDYIRIVYDGFPKSASDTKFIPDFCREALVGYITERAFFALQGRDLAYRSLWMGAKQDLYTSPSPGEPSKWDFALRMMKKLDKKYMDDLAEYLSKMAY